MIRSYQELSRDITQNLDKLAEIIRQSDNKEIEKKLEALEQSVRAMLSMYK